MFISRKKKLIFIHCPKTAGTSFKKILADNSENDAEILMNDEFRKIQTLQRKHLSSLIGPHWGIDVLSGFNIELKDYQVVTFVRNPWDRFVSLYNYILANEAHPLHKAANEAGIDLTIEYIIIGGKALPEHRPQHAYYEAPFKIPNLHILKSENFSAEITKISEKFDLYLTDIPHLNKATRQRIKLSKRLESLIYYHEFKTIEKFNYLSPA